MVANNNRTYLINSNRLIQRRENVLCLYEHTKDGAAIAGTREHIPIASIDELYIIKRCVIDTETLAFLSDNGIVVHFFSRDQRHVGDFYPSGKGGTRKSGFCLLQQLRAFEHETHRLYLARQFTKAHFLAIRDVLSQYKIKNSISLKLKALKTANTNEQIMGIEGSAKAEYFSAWRFIIKDQKNFAFIKRTKRPAADKINALISYVNARIYSICLCEIYKTELDPRISYLHEPTFRSSSLHLDVAEQFKPLIGDRMIFALLNKKQLKPSHFSKENGAVSLTKDGIKVVELELISRLSKAETLNAMKYNMRGVILREINKIKKSIVECSEYVSYVELKNR